MGSALGGLARARDAASVGDAGAHRSGCGRDSRAPAGRTVGERPCGTAMRAAAWTARSHRLAGPAAKASVVVLGSRGLGLLAARPPDEPKRAHDGDLEHDKEKEDRRESLHREGC